MSTEMLEDIRNGSQSHQRLNRRESHYKIRDCITRRQTELKGALLSTQNMGKGLYKVFKVVVDDILQVLHFLGKSRSEVAYFIT